jgi:periplasmic copper chaperone A
MSMRILAIAAALFAVTGSAFAQSPVSVTNPWARATPAGAATAAIYLTLQTPSADKLVSVSTPAAKQAELHTMSMEGGVMKMRALPGGIDLPAGKPVTLKPGAMHIMLSALSGPLKEGETVPLTLNFERSGTQQISVPVEKVGAMGPAGAPSSGGASGMGGMKMGH